MSFSRNHSLIVVPLDIENLDRTDLIERDAPGPMNDRTSPLTSQLKEFVVLSLATRAVETRNERALLGGKQRGAAEASRCGRRWCASS